MNTVTISPRAKAGDILKFAQPMKFQSGETLNTFKLVEAGGPRRLRFVLPNDKKPYDMYYQITHWRKRQYEIITSEQDAIQPAPVNPKVPPAVTEAMKYLKDFMPTSQRRIFQQCFSGEEKQFFFDKAIEMAERIKTMPKTYEQDGLGKNAVAHLHYFRGGCDWYITEKDMEAEQLQAFGSANLGYGAELGYISIVELVESNVELDLHFTPKPLSEIKQEWM